MEQLPEDLQYLPEDTVQSIMIVQESLSLLIGIGVHDRVVSRLC